MLLKVVVAAKCFLCMTIIWVVVGAKKSLQ